LNENDKKYKLKLFISGDNIQPDAVLENLKEAFNAILQGRYELEMVNVLHEPGRAEEHRIIATPTLVLDTEDGERRAIGSMLDAEKIMLVLGLNKPETESNQPSGLN